MFYVVSHVIFLVPMKKNEKISGNLDSCGCPQTPFELQDWHYLCTFLGISIYLYVYIYYYCTSLHSALSIVQAFSLAQSPFMCNVKHRQAITYMYLNHALSIFKLILKFDNFQCNTTYMCLVTNDFYVLQSV